LVPGALDCDLLQFRRNRADHARGDLILQIEDIIERALEAIRPQVTASGGIDQLSGDAHAVRRLAYAAFEQIANTEFTTDLLRIESPPFEREAGITGNDEQPAHARQRGGDVLDDAVRKVFLLRIAAEVCERKHGNRRPVRNRQTWLWGGRPRRTPEAVAPRICSPGPAR